MTSNQILINYFRFCRAMDAKHAKHACRREARSVSEKLLALNWNGRSTVRVPPSP
jgi:hypothetical protein